MPDASAMRAAIARDHLDTVAARQPDLLARLQLRAGTVDQMRRLSRLAWIPMPEYMLVMDAIRKAVGDDLRFRALWRATMQSTFQQPTFKVLIDGAIRLFGVTPSGLVKIAPRAWALISRDAGHLESEQVAECNTARLQLAGFPPEFLASRTMVEGLAGAVEAFYDISRCSGTVRVDHSGAAQGRATLDLAWRELAGRPLAPMPLSKSGG